MNDVVVIGGGFAGMAAAIRLAGAGVPVTLLERRPILGGRAYSFTDSATGDTVDNGQHLLMRCCRSTLAFLDSIGTKGLLSFQSGLDIEFRDRGGHASRLTFPSWLPPAAGLMAGFLRFGQTSAADTLRLWAMRRDLAHPPAPGLSVDAWLSSRSQSPGIRRAFWDPLCVSALNARPGDAPAEDLACLLGEALAERGGAGLGHAAAGLSRLYAEAAPAFIHSRGGAVETGVAVAALVPDEHGVVLTLRSGRRLAARACIAAVPPPALLRLLPSDGFGALKRRLSLYRPSPILSVNLWFDRPVLERPFVGLLGGRTDWVFNKPLLYRGNDQASAGHVAVVASAADALVGLPEGDLVGLALDDLRGAGFGVHSGLLRHATVVRERQATFRRTPGDEAVPARTGHPSLLLAGDWTATGLPPTIESAVRSGFRAADLVLAGK